jgi:hypothetical protein
MIRIIQPSGHETSIPARWYLSALRRRRAADEKSLRARVMEKKPEAQIRPVQLAR